MRCVVGNDRFRDPARRRFPQVPSTFLFLRKLQVCFRQAVALHTPRMPFESSAKNRSESGKRDSNLVTKKSQGIGYGMISCI